MPVISIIDHTGTQRFLGNNPAPIRFGWPLFGSTPTTPLIPRDRWPEFIRDAFEENLLFPPIRDQGSIGQCHTSDTEVLTDKGWISWPEYNGSDLLGTMNQVTGELEFQAPLSTQRIEYDGEMIYSTNRRIDFGVTPDHRMYVRKWDESKRTLSDRYSFVLAKDLGWYVGLPDSTRGFIGTELKRVAIEGDREYDGDDFVALLGLITSDGFASSDQSRQDRVSFCNFRPERREKVAALAHRLGFQEQASRPGVWYRLGAHALSNWIRANCYIHSDLGAKNKKVPDIIKSVAMRQICHFLDLFGDRNHGENANVCFYSSSKRMIDDLQELHLRIGKRSTICVNKPKGLRQIKGYWTEQTEQTYTLCVADVDRLCIDRKKHIETDRYKDLVYCATVPNSTLVTRRNGSVLISGNCLPAGTIIRRSNDSIPIEKVSVGDLVMTAEGHFRKVSKAFVRQEEKELVRIYHGDGVETVRSTAEHPFLTKKRLAIGGEAEFKPAGKLAGGDYIYRWCSQSLRRYESKVLRVARESFSGWVFNLEVEDEHTYVADNIAVHNCNADATVGMLQYCRNIQGIPYVEFSAADLYHQINGGGDNGSLLEDAMAAMLNSGVGTLATCRSNIWKSPFQPAPASERKLYRITEVYLCPTFDHCMSAVIQGFGMVSGIMWPTNDQLDSDGWLQRSSQAGGHAIFGCVPVGRKRGGSYEYGIGHRNSWTPQWGRQGRFVIPESYYRGPVGGWWAARVATGFPSDVPTPA